MSVINKMLRDLDSRQAEGTLAVSGAGPVAGMTRGTFSVEADTAKSSDARRRVLPWLALAGMLLALAAVGAWWLYSTAHPNVALALPPSAVKAIATAQPASAPPPAASAPAAPPMGVASAPDVAASAAMAAAVPASAPVTAASAAATTLVAAAPAQAASTATAAPVPAPVPPLPMPAKAAAQAAPATPTPGSAAAQVATVAHALAPVAAPTATPAPSPAAAAAAKQAPVSAAPAAAKPPAKAEHGTPAQQPSASAAPAAARTPQAAAMETLAQAQALWNGGARDAARDMLRDAVATAERANLAVAPGGMTSFVLLVRELCRMELADGQAAAVVALLARLEPQLAEQADIWALRGNAAQRLGRHQESANAYLAALKLRPAEGRWMLGAAVSLAALGQTAAAGDWAEKARAAGAVSPEVMNYLRQAGVPLRER